MLTSLSLNQFLMLYIWFPLAALLFFLLLIARFYQKFSGERTYFEGFLLPVILFGAAAVRYASLNSAANDVLADMLSAAGGVILIGLCIVLYRLMILQREKR